MLGIPSPSSPTFGARVKEALERLLGQRGDPLGGVVTFHDLVNIGVITRTGSGRAGPSSPGAALVSNEQNFDRTPPPKPVAVTIDVAYLRAFIQWSVPSYGNHAYAEVWRASADDLDQAVLHQQVSGSPQALAEVTVQFGETWYYWVRFVSRAGVVGPWHSTSGLRADGPTDVAAVLSQLGEEIDLGLLGADVTDTLDLVPGLQTQIDQLQGTTVADVYLQDEKPLPSAGGSWVDIPPDNSRWYDTNDSNSPHIWGTESIRNAQYEWFNVSGNIYRLEANGGGDPGLAKPDSVIQVGGSTPEAMQPVADNTLPGTIGEWSWFDTGAGYSTVYINYTSSPESSPVDSYLAGRWVSVLDPRVSANEADISALDVRLTTAEGDITANASAFSALDTTVTNLNGVVAANSSDITSLESRITTAEGDIGDNATSIGANSSAVSALDTRVTAAEGVITAQSSDITALDSRLTTAEGDVVANAGAVSALDTRVTSAEGDITAQASQITTLTTEVDGNTASVTSLSSSVNGLEARQGVRLDVNGYVTGYVQNNDGQQGEFIILADKFLVRRPDGGGSSIAPFAVVNGVVYIDAARIRDGTIADAKIGDLSADKITTGRMSANRIFGGTINGNNVNVTNLDASNISTGTLSASLINLDGLTLENAGGLLRVKNGGIDTGQLVDNAVSRLDANSAVASWTSTSSGTWQDAATVTVTSTGKPIRIHASGLLTRVSGGGATFCWVRVARDATDISLTTSSAIWLPGGATFHTPWSVSIPQNIAAGTYDFKIQIKPFTGIPIKVIRPTVIADEFKK